jgi:soluble lytic murein transglycosylase
MAPLPRHRPRSVIAAAPAAAALLALTAVLIAAFPATPAVALDATPAAAPAVALDAASRATPSPDDPAVRQEFLAAMQRAARPASQSPGAAPTDSAALQNYILYDYLLAARLRRDLVLHPGDELDAAVDNFLKGHAGEPVSRALRHDWLTRLAERGRWDWFLPRAESLTDPALLCDRLQGRLDALSQPTPASAVPSGAASSGDAADAADVLAADALALWRQPQRPAPQCTGVFAWLHARGLISPALIEVRTRAALGAGDASLGKEFAAELPPPAAAPFIEWARLLETPRPLLDALARDPSRAAEPDALEAGFRRLARSDAAAALTLLPQLVARPGVSPAQRGRLERDAAVGAAYERLGSDLPALEAIPADALDDEAWQWRVRAALWHGDFARALSWIDQMPTALAAQPRWRYWRARALEITRGGTEAEPLFAALAATRDYYGYLAADRLHRPYALDAQSSPVDDPAQTALSARPGIQRAHELFRCGLIDDANAEWANELATAAPDLRVQAAELASRWSWYAQSIATLAQSGQWNDVRLRYPRPYAAEIGRASGLARVPPDWILAVMRQESLLRPDAVSRAGARGLMQLLPATASALARRWQWPNPGPDGLSDPAIGIDFGAAYLREMLDRFGDQLGPALAAYNAGPIAVARWMPAGPMDADIWVENIAYGETRDYLQRIFEHIVAYAWVRDAEPPRLALLLPRITPAGSAERAARAVSGRSDAQTPAATPAGGD